MFSQKSPFIIPFSEMDIQDLSQVGWKNASLGEMIKHLEPSGVNIPDGFAITSEAYRNFVKSNKLESEINYFLDKYQKGAIEINETGRFIRQLFNQSIFPITLAEHIQQSYREFSKKFSAEKNLKGEYNLTDVAVRSSAIAYNMSGASFAGLHESYLNIHGIENLITACKKCFASLFTNRAIIYREKMGFDHMDITMSIGVQKMVRADKSSSGVMFTIDTETGFPNVIMINGSWGLGENVVRGVVNPDQFYVFKPLLETQGRKPILEKNLGSKTFKKIYSSDEGNSTINIPTTLAERKEYVLNDDEILQLAKWGLSIENHYQKPMDIEWVKDDETGQIFIVQARPETVHSKSKNGVFKSYSVSEIKPKLLMNGFSVGSSIVSGTVKIVKDTTDLAEIDQDTILVTKMTDPDWMLAIENVAGIVTDFGSPTCHAAIVSRELGIPAVVGTEKATKKLKKGQEITISSAEGNVGKIYEGTIKFRTEDIDLGKLPRLKTKIMMNISSPESAFKWWKMPVSGIGLTRIEFLISSYIKIHPMALVHPENVTDENEYRQIRKLTTGYKNLRRYFVDRLASGIAKIAASQYPKPVVVRTSDFNTNEYAGLIGGSVFEPHEVNPMLGLRGASRYYSESYKECFELECQALRKVREEIGLDNIIVMIPFCRTLDEAEKVLTIMAEFGLSRGENGLQIYMMCEIPSNLILAEEFAIYFDGFSIGSNDLTQLILGVDRDSGMMAHLFNENDPAVKRAIRDVIQKAHNAHIKIGFCGQAPSNDAEYAKFLVKCGIDSISVEPDSLIEVVQKVAEEEAEEKKTLLVDAGAA